MWLFWIGIILIFVILYVSELTKDTDKAQKIDQNKIDTPDYTELPNNDRCVEDDDEVYPQEVQFVICIKCCAPRFKPFSVQYKQWEYLSKKYPIKFYYVIGDMTIENEYIINEEQHTITVKAPDDYFNLPRKVGKFIEAVYEETKHLHSIKGYFFTDDDIYVNTKSFYNFLNDRKDIPYWGKKITLKSNISYYIQRKIKQSKLIRNTVETKYPALQTYGIEQPVGVVYTSGGATYLNRFVFIQASLLANQYFLQFPETNEELLENHISENFDTPVLKNVTIFEDITLGKLLNDQGIKPVYQNVRDIVYWEGLV